MKSTLSLAIEQVAREQGISISEASAIYKSYWRYIRSNIPKYDLNEVDEDTIKESRINFNIPGLGKLYTTYDIIVKNRNKQKYLEENVKVKRDKTPV